MESGRDLGWREQLIEARAAVLDGSSPGLYRSVKAGHTVKVAPGIYLPAGVWNGLRPDDRFRARIDAAAMRFPGEAPFSHSAAMVLWGLPNVSAWPGVVEVIAERQSGGRSRRGIVRHGVGLPESTETIDGHCVTSLARTVADAASVLPFSAGVAVTDHVMRRPRRGEKGVTSARATREEILDEIEARASPRGGARALRAVELADGLSGSPGESLSRCGMLVGGMPTPELQTGFSDAAGVIGFVDFWWPEWGVIGEFDGVGKYLREELRAGQTVAEVVVAEKVREDRLRAATGARVVRWGWDVARSHQLLATLLQRAGLPQRRRFS